MHTSVKLQAINKQYIPEEDATLMQRGISLVFLYDIQKMRYDLKSRSQRNWTLLGKKSHMMCDSVAINCSNHFP